MPFDPGTTQGEQTSQDQGRPVEGGGMVAAEPGSLELAVQRGLILEIGSLFELDENGGIIAPEFTPEMMQLLARRRATLEARAAAAAA